MTATHTTTSIHLDAGDPFTPRWKSHGGSEWAEIAPDVDVFGTPRQVYEWALAILDACKSDAAWSAAQPAVACEPTNAPGEPAGLDHQPREHATACRRCHRPTWAHDAVCSNCKALDRAHAREAQR